MIAPDPCRERGVKGVTITSAQARAEGWYVGNTTNGLCECGCGSATKLAETTSRSHGTVRGEPMRFLHRHQMATNISRTRQKEKTCGVCSSLYVPTSARQKRCTQCAPDKTARKRLREHGLTEFEYQRILIEQGHRCAICRAKPLYKLVVDHDHKSGRIRGLLCHRCNGSLWFVEENLKSALVYLSRQVSYGESVKHLLGKGATSG